METTKQNQQEMCRLITFEISPSGKITVFPNMHIIESQQITQEELNQVADLIKIMHDKPQFFPIIKEGEKIRHRKCNCGQTLFKAHEIQSGICENCEREDLINRTLDLPDFGIGKEEIKGSVQCFHCFNEIDPTNKNEIKQGIHEYCAAELNQTLNDNKKR